MVLITATLVSLVGIFWSWFYMLPHLLSTQFYTFLGIAQAIRTSFIGPVRQRSSENGGNDDSFDDTNVQQFVAAKRRRRKQEEDEERKQNRRLFGLIKPIYLVWLIEAMANVVSLTLELYGCIFHSYEVVGLENIPSEEGRPALLIFYHGVIPLDMPFVANKIYRHTGRTVSIVADRFITSISNRFVGKFIFSGPSDRCVSVLKDGNLLEIAPGGTREAQFATSRYETMWNNRFGFARVAKAANVDIIPIFTENIRQVYYIPRILQWLLRPLYELTRMPVVPFFGGFPVKLRTHIGKAISPDSAESASELAQLVQKSIETLIAKHQQFPATISYGLFERLKRNGSYAISRKL